MRNVTVIVPSYNTLEHLKNTYKSLKKYAPEAKLILIDDASEDGTGEWLLSIVNQDPNLSIVNTLKRKGHTYWYDEGMRRAQTDVVTILHSDMIIGPNYLENMYKHLERGKVVCATRIEPPIHPEGLEKIVRDFGDEANNIKWEALESFIQKTQKETEGVTTRGIFAPWMLYKQDHLSIGGHDQRFAPYGYEDSDIFNRWILEGYEMVQSRDSLCYHLTCRGHRWNKGVGVENSDYKETMDRCRREFIRKWGDWIQNDKYQYPIIRPKYDVGIQVTTCNSQLLDLLEPWCSDILIDDEMQVLTTHYLDREQSRTVESLSDKIHSTPFETLTNDVIITVDGKTFTDQDYGFITQIAAILQQNKPEPGEFALGNLNIKINKYHEEKVSSRV